MYYFLWVLWISAWSKFRFFSLLRIYFTLGISISLFFSLCYAIYTHIYIPFFSFLFLWFFTFFLDSRQKTGGFREQGELPSARERWFLRPKLWLVAAEIWALSVARVLHNVPRASWLCEAKCNWRIPLLWFFAFIKYLLWRSLSPSRSVAFDNNEIEGGRFVLKMRWRVLDSEIGGGEGLFWRRNALGFWGIYGVYEEKGLDPHGGSRIRRKCTRPWRMTLSLEVSVVEIHRYKINGYT